MKILDKTPYRTETGEIDFFGRVQSMLTRGPNWYARIQAQSVVIAIMEKALGEKYVLVRNATLPDTEIELPLILVGPQGVFLINVIHERGVYRAKDDEWGTVRSEKFVPAAINQVKRTLRMGRVLQVYLDRAGYKDLLVVDPILMSADPGTHIESTRPAVRIIMSDALERFAISINQGRSILSAEAIYGIVKTILTGPPKKAEAAQAGSDAATPASGGRDTTDALFAGAEQPDPDSLDFSYNEEAAARASSRPAGQRPSAAYQAGTAQNAGGQSSGSQEGGYQDRGFQESEFQDTGFQDLGSREGGFTGTDIPGSDSLQPGIPAFLTSEPDDLAETESNAKPLTPKKKGPLGMTTAQFGILIGLLLCWLCAMAGFAAYVYFSLNG